MKPTVLQLLRAAALRIGASCSNADASELLGSLTAGKLVYETLELALVNRAVVCRFAKRSSERITTDGKGAAAPLGTTSSSTCFLESLLGGARGGLRCTRVRCTPAAAPRVAASHLIAVLEKNYEAQLC